MIRYSIMFHHFHHSTDLKIVQGSITRDNLCSILDYLEDSHNIISPIRFLEKYESNALEPTDVCITFDDALKSQYEIAYKELKARNIKAFFFVYSGIFDNIPPPFEFYRDFRTISFNSANDFYHEFFKLAKEMFPDKYETFLSSNPESYAMEVPFYTNNDRKFRFIRDKILGDFFFDIMESMMVKHGYSKHKRKELLFMTPDDVKLLYQEGHAIGLHSHSHPTQFCELGYEKQLMEYTKNLEIIRSITTEGVWSMSHPSGSYNDETLTILKELGIRIGFRSTPSEKNIKSCFEIPREDHATVFKYISSL